MRLLDKENLRLDMTKLGFEPESLEKFEKAVLKPYGMVLVTGPTGSGKTNTLYSSIAKLNTPERDSRLRDRRDRRQGGAHRPPRSLHSAHQRRPQHHQPSDEHGH
jgi:ABC-type lipoprotein export system ATPase subunit